ncbi:MAG: tyrosine-type recombinase/integrase [Planctomycetaceae bacterium]|nr:tyrosine-type recombinase/integrase [Planctomycetaceae bacterium]
MPRPRKSIPTLSENARGYLYSRGPDGRQVWFGHKTNPESAQKYARFITAVQTGEPVQIAAPVTRPTINEVCLRFLTEHCLRYRGSDGKPSAEVRCLKGVTRILRQLYGRTVADDFGPLKLRAVRQAMIEAGWTRRFINKQIGRLRLIFRVAVSWEMVRADVLAALDSVPALASGESKAIDNAPRQAISQADLDAVRAQLSERPRDLFDLMLLTGARPGELLRLTTGMIDREGELWRCELAHHKTSHHGKTRVLLFNVTAQAILRRYFQADPDCLLFPVRGDTFADTIKAATIRAGVTPFTPHALRHTVATRLADEMGTEAAQRLLGHATRAMTEHYSKAAERLAGEAVRKLG